MKKFIFIFSLFIATNAIAEESYINEDLQEQIWLEKQIFQGDAYLWGEQGLEQDIEKAISLYKLAANKGYPPAFSKLGDIYSGQFSIDLDFDESLKWYQLAADSGEPVQISIAKLYLQNGNEKEAITQLKSLVSENDPEAQYELAFLYLNNDKPNIDVAINLLKLAALNGHLIAQNTLGDLYSEDSFRAKRIGLVEENDNDALTWYQLAIKQNDSYAQYRAGKIYINGLGVQKNYNEAIKLLTLAANQGQTEAQNLLWYLYGGGENKSLRNDNEAFKWLKISSDSGDPTAKYTLATLYLSGEWKPVQLDKKLGIQLLKESCEEGNWNACDLLESVK